MQVKKQQLELDMEQQTGSKLGKEYVKAVYCHSAFQLICRVHHVKYRLDEAQAGIKITGRNVSYLRYTDDTTLMAESKEELKSFMANRWGNNGNSDRLFSWALKSLQMVTAAMKLKDTYSLQEKL